MNPFILIAKILLVAFFLLMFLRSNKLVWGVGLLTVTTAILLDTLLSTFSRDEMLTQLGFFFYVIIGGLIAGAALWVWAILAPTVRESSTGDKSASTVATMQAFGSVDEPEQEFDGSDTAFDRQMLFKQMRERLSPDDLLDVIFDLGWPENDVIAFGQDNNQLINNIIDRAARQGQSGELTLAVERILTPIPKENLPRLEKLNVDSPPTILRHYLLAYYDVAGLRNLASEANVDWELLGGDSKKTKARNLLLYLQRRNRLGELVDLLKTGSSSNI